MATNIGRRTISNKINLSRKRIKKSVGRYKKVLGRQLSGRAVRRATILKRRNRYG